MKEILIAALVLVTPAAAMAQYALLMISRLALIFLAQRKGSFFALT